jgi:hypothetical protein
MRKSHKKVWKKFEKWVYEIKDDEKQEKPEKKEKKENSEKKENLE